MPEPGVGGRDLETSSFSSISLGFQQDWKLTIGRPGLSLTIVGVGSRGLRSFNLMLVAARISSPLISFPSFIFIPSSTSVFSSVGLGGVAGRVFEVYAGSRDCEGGFLCISNLSNFFVPRVGSVLDRSRFCLADCTLEKGLRLG